MWLFIKILTCEHGACDFYVLPTYEIHLYKSGIWGYFWHPRDFRHFPCGYASELFITYYLIHLLSLLSSNIKKNLCLF